MSLQLHQTKYGEGGNKEEEREIRRLNYSQLNFSRAFPYKLPCPPLFLFHCHLMAWDMGRTFPYKYIRVQRKTYVMCICKCPLHAMQFFLVLFIPPVTKGCPRQVCVRKRFPLIINWFLVNPGTTTSLLHVWSLRHTGKRGGINRIKGSESNPRTHYFTWKRSRGWV